MKSKLYITLLISIICTGLFAQVGIGTTTPNESSILHIESTDRGILIPRISLSSSSDTTTINGTEATGLLVYNNATVSDVVPGFYYWNGTQWIGLGDNWRLSGNSGTDDTVDFLGTTDNANVVFKTNSTKNMELRTNGGLYIDPDGSSTTAAPLVVNGDVIVGGGADDADGLSEYIKIEGDVQDWFVAVDAQTLAADSDLFIGNTSDPGDSHFRIQPSGNISIGADEDFPDDILQITKDQDDTTTLRLDNTNDGTDIDHTAVELWDGSSLEGFFRHNNFSDVLEIGHQESDGVVNLYSGDGTGANSDITMILQNDGNVRITGDLTVDGNLAKGGGTFKIDHPLDPKNKYLYHSFVESPDMMNVYNGNVTTDAEGFATVQLPDYFKALNKDFRYQLTTVGSFSRVMVYEKIIGNRFVVKSEEPNVEISWQVTGIRNDPYSQQNRVVPEVEKEEKGTYLHPKAYNQN